eukprot:CAMPEP_0176082910 /NCGR_PEP_ID=MMETSP0120_2-20121206/41475_1 /TAXON_ID=160619 /ORGANISM="Kryptoperidinium foliaceum, Strain CCMP 1326" /LENGTH=219 /DNA_ID=CAMNT_0017416683 /DNA_START=62 /DNA_END=718 /DNA_ORIENTATION=+
MGEACWAYYPLAAERRFKCEGERHCPECHGIIHQSHSECRACLERRTTAAKAAQEVPTAPSLRALPSGGALKALPSSGAASAPKTAFDALCDKFQGMEPEEVLKQLEAIKTGKAAEEEALARAAAEAGKLQREKQDAQRDEKAKARELAQAQAKAREVEESRNRRRSGAMAIIQAMLDADGQQAAQPEDARRGGGKRSGAAAEASDAAESAGGGRARAA